MTLVGRPKSYQVAERHTEQLEKLLVLNNFYGTATTIAVPAAWRGKAVTKVLGNYPTTVDQLGTQLALQPYESLVLKG